jgi:hypothetical protein
MGKFEEEYPLIHEMLSEVLKEEESELQKSQTEGNQEEAEAHQAVIDEIKDLFEEEFEDAEE